MRLGSSAGALAAFSPGTHLPGTTNAAHWWQTRMVTPMDQNFAFSLVAGVRSGSCDRPFRYINA